MRAASGGAASTAFTFIASSVMQGSVDATVGQIRFATGLTCLDRPVRRIGQRSRGAKLSGRAERGRVAADGPNRKRFYCDDAIDSHDGRDQERSLAVRFPTFREGPNATGCLGA
ncbi:hypothetical protein GCM10011335_18140 [Aureimonas glaciei]|uniref:Uncharacterized protein n=1 Tax=Aureimonas glaciei TaxID=1776957 RepID=A0A917D9Z1_9HYPH|nr:hypothetical protein GCM10011335_18140 [Aureimonas glaciei]